MPRFARIERMKRTKRHHLKENELEHIVRICREFVDAREDSRRRSVCFNACPARGGRA
jgi:hypothetical protein